MRFEEAVVLTRPRSPGSMAPVKPPRDASAAAGAFLVAIPTYNERENIDGLLSTLLELYPAAHVVVIDDGSPDGTGDLVAARADRDSRVHLIRRLGKAGLGSAYREAFAWALDRGFALVAQMDADWSHDPRDLSRLVEATEETDVAVGSRYVAGGRIEHWPRSRLLLSRLANTLARLVVGGQVRDLTSGFKCYRASVLKALPFGPGGITSEGYSFQVDILYHCRRAGFRVREVPIVFIDRRHGRSKMSRAEIWRAVRTLLRIGLRRLAG